jgi:hypothetical protein
MHPRLPHRVLELALGLALVAVAALGVVLLFELVPFTFAPRVD